MNHKEVPTIKEKRCLAAAMFARFGRERKPLQAMSNRLDWYMRILRINDGRCLPNYDENNQ